MKTREADNDNDDDGGGGEARSIQTKLPTLIIWEVQ
jgi:hypothetical protein